MMQFKKRVFDADQKIYLESLAGYRILMIVLNNSGRSSALSPCLQGISEKEADREVSFLKREKMPSIMTFIVCRQLYFTT